MQLQLQHKQEQDWLTANSSALNRFLQLEKIVFWTLSLLLVLCVLHLTINSVCLSLMNQVPLSHDVLDTGSTHLEGNNNNTNNNKKAVRNDQYQTFLFIFLHFSLLSKKKKMCLLKSSGIKNKEEKNTMCHMLHA